MGRIVRGFLDDYRDGASRTIADSRLCEIESSLDDSAAHDDLKIKIAALRRGFSLRTGPTITDFPPSGARESHSPGTPREPGPDVDTSPGY